MPPSFLSFFLFLYSFCCSIREYKEFGSIYYGCLEPRSMVYSVLFSPVPPHEFQRNSA